jgi:hypothetical protein
MGFTKLYGDWGVNSNAQDGQVHVMFIVRHQNVTKKTSVDNVFTLP